MRVALYGAVAMALSGCASVSHALDYGDLRLADAKFETEHREFSLWLHPEQDTALIEGRLVDNAVQGSTRWATGGLWNIRTPYAGWREGARTFLQPVGCEVLEMTPYKTDAVWEFRYRCPQGVDLRALVHAQRGDLRDGKPLHLDAPSAG
jgi:hypothetical protein